MTARLERTDPRRSYAWQQARARWDTHVQAGLVVCPRCALPIAPGQPWDLGHVVDERHGGDWRDTRPEHRSCNRSAGARRRPGPAWTPTPW